MKTKIFILAAMLAAAMGTQAQYNDLYYHRTGDTINTYSDIAYYKWWDFNYLLSLGERIGLSEYLLAEGNIKVVATTYQTPATLKIVGIAGAIQYIPSPNFVSPLPEYFYLFDATPEGPVYRDRSEIHFADSTPHRCLHVSTNNAGAILGTDSCCGYSPRENYLDLYECYFDSSITVTDSFCVGWSFNNNTPYYNYHTLGIYTINHPPCSELDTITTSLSNCFFPCFDYIYCTDADYDADPQGPHSWTTIPFCSVLSRQFALVYPLIQIDTTVPPSFLCDPVQNFSATVLDSGSGCVFFTWDDFYHYTFCEVQYYTFEQGYNSAVTTTVTGNNLLHLCDLDTTLTYFARIRAYCDTSKIETEWSNWVSFTFPHSAPPQGVAEPSLLDRFTHVMPNPAADRVTVSSELGLRRIEVYNARGILVYSEPSHYSSKTIDLRGWPSGQYMMTIETRQGKTAKRLVVAR